MQLPNFCPASVYLNILFATIIGLVQFAAIGTSRVSAQVLEDGPAEELAAPDPVLLPPKPKPVDNEALLIPAADDDTTEMDEPVEPFRAEPLKRGPVHEAFAEPLELTPSPGSVIARKPPTPIEEVPPELGDQSDRQWVPGYWAWDKTRDDFVWVSGVWRRPPVGRSWQPGSWESTEEGYRWTAGFWAADEAQAEPVFVPNPPESLEEGPVGPAPSQDHFWVPGVWTRMEQRFVWRPGFWSQGHTNWVWVPDHYVWTPLGCRFVPGYWDFPWEGRGTLYAPIAVPHTTVFRHVIYRPTVVVDSGQWLSHLWMLPGYGHYYFGDYYDHVHLGYSPWHRYGHGQRRHYDPLYAHYSWSFGARYGVSLFGHLDGLHVSYSRYPRRRPSIHHIGHDHWHRDGRRHAAVRTSRDLFRERYGDSYGRWENRLSGQRQIDSLRRDLNRSRLRTGSGYSRLNPLSSSGTRSTLRPIDDRDRFGRDSGGRQSIDRLSDRLDAQRDAMSSGRIRSLRDVRGSGQLNQSLPRLQQQPSRGNRLNPGSINGNQRGGDQRGGNRLMGGNRTSDAGSLERSGRREMDRDVGSEELNRLREMARSRLAASRNESNPSDRDFQTNIQSNPQYNGRQSGQRDRGRSSNGSQNRERQVAAVMENRGRAMVEAARDQARATLNRESGRQQATRESLLRGGGGQQNDRSSRRSAVRENSPERRDVNRQRVSSNSGPKENASAKSGRNKNRGRGSASGRGERRGGRFN